MFVEKKLIFKWILIIYRIINHFKILSQF
jgi:hypothetical protein